MSRSFGPLAATHPIVVEGEPVCSLCGFPFLTHDVGIMVPKPEKHPELDEGLYEVRTVEAALFHLRCASLVARSYVDAAS